jgi:hypothetical protein
VSRTPDPPTERPPLLSGERSGFYVFRKRISERLAETRDAAWPWILVAIAIIAALAAMAR